MFRRFEGQPNEKLRAVRTGAKVNFPVMPFHDDPMTYHQSEPGSRAALGGKKGHEKDMRLRLSRDSTAVVGDLDEEKLAIAPRANIDTTGALDRIDRVVD